ncbi:SDR family NAD(P)-dependent oxidoreductase [Shewanella baltica]|uniref:SDR family NAD(P)-dependent oxidoreductase n=1 Tax=Shewanella baltica TaxID=62322 RepID=UPI0028717D59|nr:SDR family NAD(P)-dependent oxidoreductase [Shewanella baltica]MDR9767633.1 SDR family NAD(P)-dependent oxidoreductase [Shewanella baltica]
MNQRALITGGSRGIGLAIAKSFAAQGSDLILLAKNSRNLERARRDILSTHPNCQIQLIQVDMQYPEAVDQAITSLLTNSAPINILVNSAGILLAGTSKLSAAQVSTMLTINTTSTMIITNHLADHMKRIGAGYIFILSSRAGVENLAKLGVYAASKAALISYSEALYKELLPFNVHVTCLCPSVVNTDMTNDGRIDNASKIQVVDIVNAVDFLLTQGEHVLTPRLDLHSKALSLEQLKVSL